MKISKIAHFICLRNLNSPKSITLKKLNPMIKVQNMQKVFRTEEVETWALNDVTLEVNDG